MKTIFLIVCLVISTTLFAQKLDVAKQIKLAETQYMGMLAQLRGTENFPQSAMPDGSLKTKKSEWWCSGFFGGSLWHLYEFSKDDKWKVAADKWSMAVQKEQYNTKTHDLGFMLYCSLGNGYRLTGDERYKPILLRGAASLATRFNPATGVIKSWDNFKDFSYPVIIDNMMNLEFLFWAARQSTSNAYRTICLSHADKTLQNHFRKDNSSYHVVCYDTTNGKVLAKKTAQGFSDSSAWARGQAWGLYGYTVMYRETNDKKYLKQAMRIADFYLNHPALPADKIPFWDFNAPNIPNDVKDASAAAITAAALLELSQYSNRSKKNTYFKAAEQMLQNLSGPEYFTEEGNNHFLLKHSTGHKPANSEIDVPIIYADYYYLEALLRYDKLVRKK